MDVQAITVLTTLKKPTATADAKVQQLNELKSAIKHLRVPAPAQATVFECVRTAIGSQTAPQLVPLGFSTLSHLIKRLGLQKDDATIAGYGPKLLPVLLERLGDQRETHRAAASQALADIWIYAPAEVERVIRETVLPGLNSRAREAGMIWVVHMHQKEGLQFRSFLPLIVASLEDADNQLRETAKASIVSLFSSAPTRAKVDLKKQLAAHNVRKNTVSFILSKIDEVPHPPQAAPSVAGASFQDSTFDHSMAPDGFDAVQPTEPPENSSSASIEPLYFHSQSEWEQTVRDMLPAFAGKESNENWEARDQNISKLRRVLKGNAPTDYPTSFLVSVKTLLDGILKVSDSLRTTVSANGCQLTQELFRLLGPAMDPHAEMVLQTFVKLSASTKKINATNGCETVDIVFQSISFNQRSLQHIWFAATEKNVLLRICAPTWLRTLVLKHKGHKALIHNSGGVELVQKILTKGLTDANPKVRENSRDTYKAVVSVWPELAEPVLASLSSRDRQILENGPPSAGPLPMTRGSSAAGSSSSRSARSTLREAIAAQKRLAAKQAGPVNDRPASAMSTLSPSGVNRMRPPSALASHRPGLSGSGSTSSLPTTSGSGHIGSLMSGPARRPRRPELSRPATADPYAPRMANKPTPTASPLASPVVGAAPSFHSSSLLAQKSSPRMVPSYGLPRQMASSGNLKVKERPASMTAAVHGQVASLTKAPKPVASPEFTYPEPTYQHETMDVDMDAAPSPTTALDERTDDNCNRKSDEIENLDQDVNRGIDISLGLEVEVPVAEESPKFSPAEAVNSPPWPEAPTHSTLSPNLPPPPPAPRLEPSPEPSVLNPTSINRKTNQKAETRSKSSTPHLSSQDEIENQLVSYSPLGRQLHQPVSPQTPPQKTTFPTTDLSALSIQDSSQKPKWISGVDRSSTPQRNGSALTVSTAAQATNSPIHTMDANRVRGLLSTAVERLHARTLDPHGLRRIQDILRNPVVSDVFAEKPTLVNDLMMALLDLLESRPTDAFASGKPTSRSRVTGLKTQTLSTIRVLVTVRQKDVLAPASGNVPLASVSPNSFNAPLWIALLRSLVRARRDYADTEHISSEMWRMAVDLCAIVPPRQVSDGISALVDVLESVAPSPVAAMRDGEDEDLEGDARVGVMGLRVLKMLISRVPAENGHASGAASDPIPNPARLGQLVVSLLNSPDPDVRCDVLEICLAFHRRLVSATTGDVLARTSGRIDGKESPTRRPDSGGAGRPNGTGNGKFGNSISPSGSNAGGAGVSVDLDFSSSPFWKVVAGVKEQHLNLIAYYLARNGIESG